MRKFLVMLAFLVMCVSTSLRAQDKKLSIVFDNETSTEVFRKLENVSDYHFVVNGDVSKFKVNGKERIVLCRLGLCPRRYTL